MLEAISLLVLSKLIFIMFVDVFNNLSDFFALKVRFGITGYTFLYNGFLLKPSPVQTRCDEGKQIPVAYTRYHCYILVHLIQILLETNTTVCRNCIQAIEYSHDLVCIDYFRIFVHVEVRGIVDNH